jgi:hypothetical protein
MLMNREDEYREDWRLMVVKETIVEWLTSIKYHLYLDAQEKYFTSIRHMLPGFNMAGGSTALGETDLKASSPSMSRRRQKPRFSRRGQVSALGHND